jgi:hypothetical protein
MKLEAKELLNKNELNILQINSLENVYKKLEDIKNTCQK